MRQLASWGGEQAATVMGTSHQRRPNAQASKSIKTSRSKAMFHHAG
jgi:hypothetical protein